MLCQFLLEKNLNRTTEKVLAAPAHWLYDEGNRQGRDDNIDNDFLNKFKKVKKIKIIDISILIVFL
jgi:hypothetical protein